MIFKVTLLELLDCVMKIRDKGRLKTTFILTTSQRRRTTNMKQLQYNNNLETSSVEAEEEIMTWDTCFDA